MIVTTGCCCLRCNDDADRMEIRIEGDGRLGLGFVYRYETGEGHDGDGDALCDSRSQLNLDGDRVGRRCHPCLILVFCDGDRRDR